MKIGRHIYDIVVGDKFMDNGACVQLLTQSKENQEWGWRPNPHLSKKAIKELYAMNHTVIEHDGYKIIKII